MSAVIARESANRAIGPGSRVTLHFAIELATGEEVDTTRRSRPATFTVGDGNLPPGFEKALFGLRPGDDERILIGPENGFGPRRSENVRIMRRTDFPDAETLEPGAMIAFDGPGGELPGVVVAVSEGAVEVDFNHPLAGRELIFDVTILRVAPGD